MLMVVLISLGLAVFKSDRFNALFGENSSAFEAIARRIEFSYRYGHGGAEDIYREGYGYGDSSHEGYNDTTAGKTRFFSPLEPYQE